MSLRTAAVRPVFQGEALGSRLRLTVIADDARAREAWRLVGLSFREVDRTLSRFRADSALTALNRRAGDQRPVPVPSMLRQAIALAWRAYRLTDGLFDPRIIGALERAGERAGIPLPPSPHRLQSGERWLHLSRAGVALEAPVDLGGIGKGLALRWARDALHREGLDRFLLNAGGDLVASGTDLDGRAWAVAGSPSGEERLPRVIELRDAAVATSATTLRRWRDAHGAWQHHIIDPRSGRPSLAPQASVTVVHADPAWAEVWSKVRLITGSCPSATHHRCRSRE